jgi:hypothetical protein
VYSGSNVGIGVASPNSQLDAYTSQGGSKISTTHGTGGSYPKASGISFGATSTSLSVSNNGGTVVFTGGAGIYANNTAASDNPTDLILWTTSGGTPAARLTIASTGAATFSSSVTAGGDVTMTGGNRSVISNGGFLQMTSTSGAIYLSPNNSTAMTLTTGGNVGIGTSSPNAKVYALGASTTEAIYYAEKSTESFSGSVYTSLNYTAAGTGWNHFIGYSDIGSTTNIKILGNGNIQNANNSYGAISDVKLKENITDASPKLDDLLKVKVRNYNLIGDESKQLGVIAQELEEVFPSMIEETEDYEQVEVTDEEGNVTKERQSLGTVTKSVKYSVFVPMLIKAIQELKAEIDILKAR